MNALEWTISIAMAAWLGMAAYDAGSRRQAAAQAAADLRAAHGVAVAYAAAACDGLVWLEDVDDMVAALRAGGTPAVGPSGGGDWKVRYGPRSPLSGHRLHLAGMALELELANPNDRERGTLLGLGGRVDGTSVVVTRPRQALGLQRGRRARLARGGFETTLPGVASC